MVVTERRLLDDAFLFEKRAMRKVFAMENTWAIVYRTSFGGRGLKEVKKEIRNIFNNGITNRPIIQADFSKGYKDGRRYPDEITCIVDPAYIYNKIREFAEKDGRDWKFIGPIPPEHICGVILPFLRRSSSTRRNQAILRCLFASMEKSDNPMPVYRTDGSLVWPQELSLEQVQSITA